MIHPGHFPKGKLNISVSAVSPASGLFLKVVHLVCQVNTTTISATLALFATECTQGLLFGHCFFFCNRQFFFPQVSSQHPYAEQYIGRPHVITIDYNNTEEFDATIREILRINVRIILTFPLFNPKNSHQRSFLTVEPKRSDRRSPSGTLRPPAPPTLDAPLLL